MPRSVASRRGTGASTNVAVTRPSAVEVDQPRALGLGVLGEGVGERGAAVAHPVGQRLGTVEVAEGDVVDPVEQPGRHPGHPADADVALGLAGLAARHEGVRQHDGAGAGRAGREVAAYAVEGDGQRCLVGAHGQAPRLGQRQRVEEGEAVDGDRTVLVGQPDGGADPGGVGADEDAGGVDQPRAEPEPLRGVVVAAGQHDPGARARQPGQRLVGEPDGVDRRQRSVVDVTGDDDEVDPLGLDDLEQVVDVGRLVREHPLAVERPAQVPVGGVEDAHTTTVGADADTTREPTPGTVPIVSP